MVGLMWSIKIGLLNELSNFISLIVIVNDDLDNVNIEIFIISPDFFKPTLVVFFHLSFMPFLINNSSTCFFFNL